MNIREQKTHKVGYLAILSILSITGSVLVAANFSGWVGFHFRSASKTFTFAAAGDLGGTTNPNTIASLKSLAAINASFFAALGDLSYMSTAAGVEQQWCDFVHTYIPQNYAFELVSGNHENDGVNGYIDNYAKCLPNHITFNNGTDAIVGSGLCGARNASLGAGGCYATEYYFDYPVGVPLALIILIAAQLTIDSVSYYYSNGNTHYNWVSNTIDDARARGIPWVIVGMHKPCLSMAQKSCEPGPDLMNLLLSKRVDLVLFGHDHNYQESKQLACADSPTTSSDAVYVPSCVANDGLTGVYQKGAGTIMQITGTFGQGDYPINPSDQETSYFRMSASSNGWWNGSGTNLTAIGVPYGFNLFTITTNQITATWVQSTSCSPCFHNTYMITNRNASSSPSSTAPPPILLTAQYWGTLCSPWFRAAASWRQWSKMGPNPTSTSASM